MLFLLSLATFEFGLRAMATVAVVDTAQTREISVDWF